MKFSDNSNLIIIIINNIIIIIVQKLINLSNVCNFLTFWSTENQFHIDLCINGV